MVARVCLSLFLHIKPLKKPGIEIQQQTHRKQANDFPQRCTPRLPKKPMSGAMNTENQSREGLPETSTPNSTLICCFCINYNKLLHSPATT